MIKADVLLDALEKNVGSDVYVGVEGFVPRKVENSSGSVMGMMIRGPHMGDYILISEPTLATVKRIELTNDQVRGFTVKCVSPYKDGALITFQRSAR